MLNVTHYGFDWDEGNREKCQKHGVSLAEIESLFASKTLWMTGDEQHSQVETRHIAVGQSKSGRHLFVGFTLRDKAGKPVIRPITARYMHQKEVRRYGKEDS